MKKRTQNIHQENPARRLQAKRYRQLLQRKIMNKLLTIILSIFTIISFGQVEQAIFDSLKTISTDNYELKVPYQWREVPTGEYGPEKFFEASGLALPYSLNGSPVKVTIFFGKQQGKNLDDCKDKCLDGYKENTDREFPKDFIDGKEKIKLPDGQEAYFLNTRFHRKSNGLNQSRFDLIVYSNNEKTGYIYTVSIQYADDSYKFEIDNNLADFAKKLFSYLTIIN